MADNTLFDQVSVALDRFADALRDLCTTIATRTDAMSWRESGKRANTEDDQVNKLATLLSNRQGVERSPSLPCARGPHAAGEPRTRASRTRLPEEHEAPVS